MKKLSLSAAVLIAGLALAGCTSSPGVEVTQAPRTQGEVLSSALEEGRPEAAFDINCEVWSVPDTDEPLQVWANMAMDTWLESYKVGCPDGITFPYYYVDGFSSTDGEGLLVRVDKLILEDYAVTRAEHHRLSWIAADIFNRVRGEFPDLKYVTIQLEGVSDVEVDLASLKGFSFPDY